MAPRRRCTTCGSKQWHKEPSSGLVACSEGHVLQNYRNEATEADDMGKHALRKRTLRSGRQKKEGTSRADPKLYHGARGRFHYFECQQLLLRKQIAALTELWALPPEFEIVCRDVWALHLNLLPNPLPADPYHTAEEPENAAGGTEQSPGLKKSPSDPPDEKDKDRGEGDANEEDEEIIALLEENSDVDLSSGSETEAEESGQDKVKHKKGGKKGSKGRYVYEKPASTIAVLVVAFWIMRIPVLYRDLTRLIETYELPYLDPVSRRLLPESMIIHLTKDNIQALSPHHGPSTLAVHGLASRLSRLLYSSYGVIVPEANGAPILWRVISKGLCGTPTLYALTKRLAQVLSLPLTLYHTPGPGLEASKGRDNYENIPPEVAFVGAGIIVLKMVYGLDGQKRFPRDAEDPACALPRIDEYLRRVEEMDDADSKRKAAVFDSRSTMSAGDLTEDVMDEYIGFCSRALVGDGGDVDTVVASYFPMEGRGGDGEGREGGGSGGTERRDSGTATGEGPRPGEGYRIYSARDVRGTVPAEYERVLQRGARWAGVAAEVLGAVVEKYERRVVRWRQ